MHRKTSIMLAAMAGLALMACRSEAAAPDVSTQLLSVAPAGGAANVDPASPIAVEFTHPMMLDMTRYMAVHQGGIAGPEVPGSWSWSDDSTTATFTPAAPLSPGTEYAIHLGGAMHDAQDHMVSFEHGEHMGGYVVTGQLMNGAMMDHSAMGGGAMSHSSMMGEGWAHADGTYGMMFTFTTAG